MKVLVVHEVNYLTKPIYEMHEIPESLASRGHEVHFLHHPESTSLTLPKRGESWRSCSRTALGGAVILHTPLILGIPVLDRIFAVLTHFFYIAKLMMRVRFDIVILYGVPTNGPSSIFWARITKTPIVYRAIDVSHKIRKTAFWPAIRMVEKHVIKNVDWVSANNGAMIHHCKMLAGRSDRMVVHLPPIDLGIFTQAQSAIDTLKPIRLLYVGSFFYFSGLPQVLRSLKAELEINPDSLSLTLVGFGEQETELSDLIQQLQLLAFVDMAGYVPYEDLPGIIAGHDICLNPMEVGEVSNFALPNKVIQYLAMGKPVISTKLLGLSQTFSNSVAIYYSESPENIINQVQMVLADKELDQRLSATKEEIANFQTELSIENFESFLIDVVNRG